MNNDNYKILKDLFSNTNHWLNFAEAKNAGLLALTGASFLGLLALLNNKDTQLNYYFSIYLQFASVVLLLAVIFCLISFVPQTKFKWLSSGGDIRDSDNLFFFGHIAKYNNEKYQSALTNKKYCSAEFSLCERDLIDQIITNSLIAERKYKLFRIAVWITLSSIITPVFGLYFYYRFDPNFYSK